MDAASIVPLGLSAPFFSNAAPEGQQGCVVIPDELFEHLENESDVVNMTLEGKIHQCHGKLRHLAEQLKAHSAPYLPEEIA